MTDGDSIPGTPQAPPGPPLDPFFDPAKALVERAAILRHGRPARARLVLFQTLVSELLTRRTETPSDRATLSDLFTAAFGDPTGSEFWRLKLQAWVDPSQFAEMLATFLAVESRDKASHKLAIGTLLAQDLTRAGVVPTVVEKAYAPIIGRIDPVDGQHHAFVVQPTIRLEGDSFNPIVPLRWLAENDSFHDWLPSSLLTFLRGSAEQPVKDELTAPQARGRPTGSGYDVLDAPFVERIVAMVRNGEASSVAAAAQIVVGDGLGVPGGGKASSKADRLRRKATNVLGSGE